jgi:hypothetical protein
MSGSDEDRFRFVSLQLKYRNSLEDLRRERETLLSERSRHRVQVAHYEQELAVREARYRKDLEEARGGSSSGGNK